ncbi:amino acid adenylation domain-containing protein [Methylosinus sp. sav-2]|uniref:hybrid non-ribosomal peptide synthetase/type I polyketide synthase n=1 Tax=Methylosinus sp. sav-2 TaxID=2485168 RepID=UPI000478ACE1|nr:hybrid non-ribosomal peptide synthetase/type I polyketide synthase [Methylosinus sp. sav-2]TDX62566.1 amino acid adenylation domain-containing protein [Methylosinus sp. sav-2]
MSELEFKKKAIVALETLRRRVAELEAATREPIAIIGYEARFPGGADAEAFWEMLRDGREGVGEVSLSRWDAEAVYNADPDAPGKSLTRRAGLLDSIDDFDAQFFGVAPREASCMDPQHRLLLETSWRALEHAGVAASELEGARAGVWIGVSTHEYLGLLVNNMTPETIDAYYATGTSPAAGAGRISYRLGLEGPAVTVDTACSSSLVAIHQACQALRLRECDLALAGGVNAILTPALMISMSRARMLAPDGKCKTFDAAADGYVRGEGCGVIVLKRLSDALRDGDRIRAVLRGGAVNQDGSSGGLTVPSGRAQQRVIRAALDQAGLTPADVDYLEAHGTGTSLGDPIEAQAAAAALGPGRAPDRPLLIGSVKTNIGHLEAAAGVAGVIKVTQALENELLPEHLHFRTPSPHIPWKQLPLKVVSEARPWLRAERKRRAGVSSFGFSGTNAHVILEEAPAAPQAETKDAASSFSERPWHMLPLSARSVPALKALARSYIQRVETLPSASALADVCHSAGVGRSHLEHRAAIVAEDGAEAARLLEAFADERASAGVYTGFAADPPKTAWLFTGQGGQYSGMGRELYETQPLFKETLDQCAAAIADMLPGPLLEVMFAEDGAINHTSYAQPALFALEMGLARLWRSWGVTPDVVLGHSVGQYAAACVAGVFTLEQGARLLTERGRLFGALPAGGLMAAIFAEAEAVEARLAAFPHVSIAAYNGAHIVVSGPQPDVRALAEMFRSEGRRTEELETSHAFHSELLEPALDAFERFAGETPFEAPTRTLICNRTGKPLAAQTRLDAQYWRRHSREPVRFAQSAQTLAELGCRVLLEVGPQPVLAAMSLRAWPEGRPTPQAVASLRRDVSDARQIEEALGQLYAAGARIDFRAVDAPWRRSKVDLPKYPFQRKRFWFQAVRRDAHSFSGSGEERAAALASDDSLALPADTPAAAAPDSWLADAPQEERRGLVVERLKAEIGYALHMSAEDIDPHTGFAALGMDSLTAMELRSRLQAALGAAIPVALFIESPDVATLATRLLDWWEEQRGAAAKRQPPMTRRPRDGSPLPLSFNQEALWFLHELAPGSSAYNIAAAVRIRGALDAAVMQRSLDAIVARHESLRTSFRSERGVAQPQIFGSLRVPLPVETVRDEEEAAEWARREAGAPFDLAQAPLFRTRLLRFDETHHILLVTMHHIVTDGWSFAVLLRELSAVYRAFATGEAWPLPELPIQYADYAAWQRDWLAGEMLGELLEFWKAELSGAAPLALPTDRPPPRTPSFRGRRLRFALGAERAKALRALAQAEGVTLFSPLLAALAAVLQRHSGQDEFIVGAMSANRGRLEIEGLIGLFVNALPVRVVLDGDPDMRALIARLGARVQGAMAHQDAPFDHVVNAVERERDGSRNPLYRVQLLLQGGLQPPAVPGLEIDVQEIDTQTAKRDLTFTIFDDAAMAGHVEYSTDLFDAPRIERLLRHFLAALDGVLADPARRLSTLPLLTPEERDASRAPVEASSPAPLTVAELLESVAVTRADVIACEDDERRLTYAELQSAARRLARWLRAKGIRPGDAVAMRTGRKVDMIVGMLGVMKAGAVYVPIDESYPRERIAHMLAEANVALDVSAPFDADVARQSDAPLEALVRPSDPAYIVFTSGSTGRPKGVVISHGAVAEYAQTLRAELGVVASDAFLHTASSAFSSSMRQILAPLAAGARIVIASDDERRDPFALLARIRAAKATIIDLVPSVLRQLADALASLPETARATLLDNELRLQLTASEPLRQSLVRDWRALVGDELRWVNQYGQTETSGIVSLHVVGPSALADSQAIVPIGRPRANVRLVVLDSQKRIAPIGVPGQLHIGGPCLALRYLGDAALTQERFFAFDDGEATQRLYATGDIVRREEDGVLAFVGRDDQQVKIRGVRIEPGEIERALLDHPRTRAAAVAAYDMDGEARLAAYLTFDGPAPNVLALRNHLRRLLPDHMIPSAFVTLDEMPLTANGKLDRAALPAPPRDAVRDSAFVAPRTEDEESLAEIWRDLLKLERVGADDSFFLLGGHSMLAAQLRARIHQSLGVELPLGAIFEDQTLAALAARLDGARRGATVALPEFVAAPAGAVAPASIAQLGALAAEQASPGAPGQWIDVGVQILGPLDEERQIESIREAFRRHAILRTILEPMADGGAMQRIVDAPPEVTLLGPEEAPDPLEPVRADDGRPAIRVSLQRIGDGERLLRLRCHRSLADGATVRMLLGEIGALYANGLEGMELFPLLDRSLSYADYALWERQWLTPELRSGQTAYFRRLFESGLPAPIRCDRPRGEGALVPEGAVFRFDFPQAAVDAAEALAAKERATLAMTLTAAFAAALAERASDDALALTIPVSLRHHAATHRMLGPFMNALPLRIERPGDALEELLPRVREATLGALAHQNAPWRDIISALREDHGPDAERLGDVALVIEDAPPQNVQFSGLTLSRASADRVAVRRPLTLSVSLDDGEIKGSLIYATSLFERDTIERLAERVIRALAPG